MRRGILWLYEGISAGDLTGEVPVTAVPPGGDMPPVEPRSWRHRGMAA
jgi:hypothetical protein